MAGQQIAQYFAKVSLLVENKEFAKVDQALKDVEKQLGKVVGGSAKETKAKKEATTATEKKVKAVEKETKATKDLNREQEKQNKDIARRIKQQQAILKKADAEALKQANAFLTLQKKLANANPGLKTLSQRQIAANRAAFFSNARASDVRTGQGLQYRLGAQADAKIRQMLAGQNALLASRSIVSPVSNNNKVFEELQLRLASKLKTPRHLSESQINKNRAAFFSSARILETKTGQGLQYRLGDQVAKIQQDTQRQQEKAAVDSQRQARRVSDAIEKGLRDLEREVQRAFSPVQNSRARLNAVRGGGRVGTTGGTPPSGGGGGYYKERHTSPFYLHKDRMHLFGGTALGFAPGPWGMAAAGVGLAAGGVYLAGQQVNQLRKQQTSVEMQRTQLDVASGYMSRAQQDEMNKRFFALANQTGVSAGGMIGSYSQMMKSLVAQGQSSENAFDLYKNMTLFAKGSGANEMQIERASYAIGQVYGKGYLSREEWALQLADALPGLRKFMMEVAGEKLGVKTGEGFDKALEQKTITPDMLVEAFRRAGQYAMPMVETYAGTAQAAENRLANMKLEEQMARTLTDDVIPSAKALTEANMRLYEAALPLRDAFYKVSAAALDGTTSLLDFTSELITNKMTRFKEMGDVQASIHSDAMAKFGQNPFGGQYIGQAVSLLERNWFTFSSMFKDDAVGSYYAERDGSGSYDSAEGWRAQQQAMVQEAMLNSIMTGKYGNKGFEFGNTISGNTFNFEVSLEGGTEGLEEFVNNGLDRKLTSALKYFGQNQ